MYTELTLPETNPFIVKPDSKKYKKVEVHIVTQEQLFLYSEVQSVVIVIQGILVCTVMSQYIDSGLEYSYL